MKKSNFTEEQMHRSNPAQVSVRGMTTRRAALSVAGRRSHDAIPGT